MRQAWVDDVAAKLRQGDQGAYVGFLGDEGEERVAYPDATWDRLREVKAQYDPDNLFRINQNIPPGVGRACHRPTRRAIASALSDDWQLGVVPAAAVRLPGRPCLPIPGRPQPPRATRGAARRWPA